MLPFQYTRLPFGYSLAPRTFSKCVQAVPRPLRASGIMVLTYLDDWLTPARSPLETVRHTQQIFNHVSCLGFWVNESKSSLIPDQRLV